MALAEILFGTGIVLFFILVILIIVLVWKAASPKKEPSLHSKSDLEKIKAQIGE